MSPETTTIEIRVRPGARTFRLERDKKGKLAARLTEPPEQGRANRELIRELERLLQAPVELASGTTGRRKRVRVAKPESEINAALESFIR